MIATQVAEYPEEAKYEQPIPLVIEITPGQAKVGLIELFEPGSYEHRSLRVLVDEALTRKNWSIEERLILRDILRQLDGGKLLLHGREIDRPAIQCAAIEKTELGEIYRYILVRVIKPQEGSLAGGILPIYRS